MRTRFLRIGALAFKLDAASFRTENVQNLPTIVKNYIYGYSTVNVDYTRVNMDGE